MKFLVDAHLPIAFCTILQNAGHESIHTRDLPAGNNTTDSIILKLAEEENLIVITKDSDFFYSFLLRSIPKKLVIVKFGNKRLRDTIEIFSKASTELIGLLENYDLVELHESMVVGVR